MQVLAQLYCQLDQTNKINDKIALLKDFFLKATNDDKLWLLALFLDKRPKRPFPIKLLREWAAERAGIEPWLFEECYHTVGDLAETITLLLPPAHHLTEKSTTEWVQLIYDLADMTENDRKQHLFQAWDSLDKPSTFLFNKLLTGGLRIGVSEQLIIRALAEALQTEVSAVAHQVMGNWSPFQTTFHQLIESSTATDNSKPYPFCLAYPLDIALDQLGNPTDWSAEWKWDGIRAQIIYRNQQLFIWSRGEELITDKFLELASLAHWLPQGTVLDGEILCFKNGKPLTFNDLQTRISRKNITKKILTESPVIFMAYDVLEYQNQDIRQEPYRVRREKLNALYQQQEPCHAIWKISEPVYFEKWDDLENIRNQSRQHGAEGFMLKHQTSTYYHGRKKGEWWKWKLEPFSVDAVLIYAQKGHGRRAGLYTDFTFGIWQGDSLITFAKAYSGLTDTEFEEVNRFIRQNTIEQFGPVRTVKPELVFEIGFEGINYSNRHKSGVAVRFPRILRWRKDKTPDQADTIETLKALLKN